MNPNLTEASISRDVEEILTTWRRQALNVILIAGLVYSTPLLTVLFSGETLVLSAFTRWGIVGLYAILLLLAVRPGWNLNFRIAAWLAIFAAKGMVELSGAQLMGNGRLTLMQLPLLALILSGTWVGWAMAVICTLVFGAVLVLDHSGKLTCVLPWAQGIYLPSDYWVLQFCLWLGGMLLVMIPLARLLELLKRTLVDERGARRRLEEETAERLRLEHQMEVFSEAERRQLGADLHDGLCQHLTASLLNCTNLELRFAGNAEAPALTQLRVALQDAIGMAYDVAKGLSPVDLVPDALAPALARLSRETRERHGIACSFQADPDLMIANPQNALNLYQIAREAVANAVRHAQCTQISIGLKEKRDKIELSVRDNGRQAPHVLPVPRLGLGIMAHRAKSMGATLKVEGGSQGGMEVVCQVPVGEAAQ